MNGTDYGSVELRTDDSDLLSRSNRIREHAGEESKKEDDDEGSGR